MEKVSFFLRGRAAGLIPRTRASRTHEKGAGRQGEEDATLRGSPADVRSGDPSEARPLRAVGFRPERIGEPGVPIAPVMQWAMGMGGAGAGPPPGTRCSRNATGAQQRGEPARSGGPRPDGLDMIHKVSGRA